MGDFTFAGYNDKPKPCPMIDSHIGDIIQCPGIVRSTFNCNMGKCDVCGESVSWESLRFTKASDTNSITNRTPATAFRLGDL